MLLEITNLTSHYNRIQALKETTVAVKCGRSGWVNILSWDR
jgi:ABC-type branched-subunit amino acid transport system ATPase component